MREKLFSFEKIGRRREWEGRENRKEKKGLLRGRGEFLAFNFPLSRLPYEERDESKKFHRFGSLAK